MASVSENILPCPPLPVAQPCRAPAANFRPSICLAIIVVGSILCWATIFELGEFVAAAL